MSNTSILWSVVCLTLFSMGCYAETRSSVEQVTVTHIGNAMSAYRILHGQLPTTWEQINTIIDLESENQGVMPAYGFRIQERYHFVRGRLPFLDKLQSEVLMIRVVPVQDHRDGKIKRTLIYRTKDGTIMSGTFPEEKVQKALQAAGVQIPRPPGIPEIESNINRAAQKHALRAPPAGVTEATGVQPSLASPKPSLSQRESTPPVTNRSSSNWFWAAGIAAAIIRVYRR